MPLPSGTSIISAIIEGVESTTNKMMDESQVAQVLQPDDIELPINTTTTSNIEVESQVTRVPLPDASSNITDNSENTAISVEPAATSVAATLKYLG